MRRVQSSVAVAKFAGLDVAGLVNPANYYRDPYHSGWMAQRMGTPQQSPGLYARAAVTPRFGRL
jgi:hypothetical protein